MDLFDGKVIFSRTFPEESLADIPKAADGLSITNDQANAGMSSGKEVLEHIMKDCTYILRPDAEKRSKQFISYAKTVCLDFGINTKITKYEHQILVSMDIFYSCYGGQIRDDLLTLLLLSDDFSLTRDKNKPDDRVCVSMSLYTHDTYRHGRKVGW